MLTSKRPAGATSTLARRKTQARVARRLQTRRSSTATTPAGSTATKKSSAVSEADLPPEVQKWLNQKRIPCGMYGTSDFRTVYNLGATLNVENHPHSWLYNLASGVHPGMLWMFAPFSLPSKDLASDGYHDPCLTQPPAPFTARMWGSGEISWFRPIKLSQNLLQTAEVTNKPTYKRGRSGDMIITTYTNRTCDAEDQDNVYVEEQVNYIHRDPSNKPKAHVRDASVAQPVLGEDYDFERDKVVLDEILLFRYSSMTWNSHRIHYDKKYALDEGYPTVLVHGPLQATLALDLLGMVSEALAPDEPPLMSAVYIALNEFNKAHQRKLKKAAGKGHSHHGHSHAPGEACDHDHGADEETSEDHEHGPNCAHGHDHDGDDIPDLPTHPWHARFQQLRHFAYEVKNPLFANTKVRILAKVINDEFDFGSYQRVIDANTSNRAINKPTASLQTKDLVRTKPAFVRVWIQDEADPSLVYFNATACFDRPVEVHYDTVPEEGLNLLLKDLQEGHQAHEH